MAGKADSEVKAMEATWNALSALEPDAQKRVLVWLIDKLKLSGSVSLEAPGLGTPIVPPGSAPAGSGAGAGPTPKQFMAQKRPMKDAQRITCLAYYMTHYRNTPQFKTKELTNLNTEAAGTPFSNPAVAVNNAALDGCLAPAGGGNKQITVRGEAIVTALPDQEKVKIALRENPARRRRRAKIKRGRSA